MVLKKHTLYTLGKLTDFDFKRNRKLEYLPTGTYRRCLEKGIDFIANNLAEVNAFPP